MCVRTLGLWAGLLLLRTVRQVCGRLQSPAGPLSSEGEAGLWQAAQDNPPPCGFEVGSD